MSLGFFYAKSPTIITAKEKAAIFNQTSHGPLSPSELKTLVEQSLDADKAEDIVTIEMDEQAGLADYMVIASGTSSRHVSALADKITNRLALNGIKDVKIEGQSQADWVAIDAGDIIIHLFRPEVRSFYNIEKMWNAFQPFEVVGDQIQA